jgi:microcystin-dependent protein
MGRRSYAGGAVPTTSTTLFSAADTTLTVVALQGWPDGTGGPFAVVIDKDTPQEEKVLAASYSGNDILVTTRGYDGTTARDHSVGATVEHCHTAFDANEANEHVSATTGVHGVPAGSAVVGTTGAQVVTDKTMDFGAGNNVATNIPRAASPQIDAALTANANAITAEEAARIADVDAEEAARILADTNLQNGYTAADSAHVAAPDPHAQYLTQAEGDASFRVIGAVQMYAGVAAPLNWLICDGAAVSRATFAARFGVIGTNFGVGDGTTTFNLPDLRARAPRGVSPAYPIGTNGGADSHAILAANVPPHTHAVDHNHASFNSAGTDPAVGSAVTASQTGSDTGTGAVVINTGGLTAISTHVHVVDVPNFVGVSGNGAPALAGTALDTRDPYQALNFIIRAV